MAKNKPLQIKSLTKRYGRYRGVEDINIELDAGEVFGFLGPNGAGKSTTIRTILNFIEPTEGSVSVFGKDSVKDSVDIKNHLGYLAGDIALYDKMTGRQVLTYLTSLGKQTDWKFVDELTQRLEASLDRPIKTLSKGNKQKLGLIQAFMHKPDLLVLDEPTSGLDPLMKQVFYDMVLEMKKEGKTVFVSSHDLTEVQKICDRAAFIRHGKLVAIEDVQKVDALNLRRYKVRFKTKPALSSLKKVEGVSEVKAINGNRASLTVTGSVDKFVKAIAKKNVVDLEEVETTLEDLFMHYYQEDK